MPTSCSTTSSHLSYFACFRLFHVCLSALCISIGCPFLNQLIRRILSFLFLHSFALTFIRVLIIFRYDLFYYNFDFSTTNNKGILSPPRPRNGGLEPLCTQGWTTREPISRNDSMRDTQQISDAQIRDEHGWGT